MQLPILESSYSDSDLNQPPNPSMPKLAEEAVATNEMRELAQRIVAFRKERGVTQVELAGILGVTQPMVSRFEQGEFRISSDMIIKLAGLFSVSADQLLGIKTVANGESIVPRRWVKRIRRIDDLPKRDQDALARIIDAFLERTTRKVAS